MHGVGENGKVALQRTVRRDQLLNLVATLPTCLQYEWKIFPFGGMRKEGDAYLWTLLSLGARSMLASASSKTDSLNGWALAIQQRAGYGKALVAIAAKNARTVWAMPSKGVAYDPTA